MIHTDKNECNILAVFIVWICKTVWCVSDSQGKTYAVLPGKLPLLVESLSSITLSHYPEIQQLHSDMPERMSVRDVCGFKLTHQIHHFSNLCLSSLCLPLPFYFISSMVIIFSQDKTI